MELYYKNGSFYVIDTDSYCDSPREWDNLFNFYAWHRRYASPDNNPYPSFSDFVEEYGKPDEWEDSDYLILTVSMYDHSSIALRVSKEFEDSFNDTWDSGIFGVLVASKKDICNWYNAEEFTDEILERAYENGAYEVEEYQNYCNGEVYRWEEVRVVDGELEVEDSCCGYYSFDSLTDELELYDECHVCCCDTDDEIIEEINKVKEDLKNEI